MLNNLLDDIRTSFIHNHKIEILVDNHIYSVTPVALNQKDNKILLTGVDEENNSKTFDVTKIEAVNETTEKVPAEIRKTAPYRAAQTFETRTLSPLKYAQKSVENQEQQDYKDEQTAILTFQPASSTTTPPPFEHKKLKLLPENSTKQSTAWWSVGIIAVLLISATTFLTLLNSSY